MEHKVLIADDERTVPDLVDELKDIIFYYPELRNVTIRGFEVTPEGDLLIKLNMEGERNSILLSKTERF